MQGTPRKFTYLVFFFTCLFFLGFVHPIWAKPSTPDRLIREIEAFTKKKESLNALHKMIELEEVLRTSSLNSVEKSSYFLQLNSIPLDLVQLEGKLAEDDFALGLAYEYTGTRLYLSGEFESAKSNYHKALKVLLLHGHEYRVYRWLGLIYCMLEDIDAGLDYFDKAIATAKVYFGEETVKGQEFLFALHSNVLSVYSNSYDFNKAEEHALEALNYAEALREPNFLLTARLNQAHILVNRFKADQALKVLDNAQELLMENTKEAINYYNIRGIAYFKKEQYKEAISAFQRSNSMIPSQSVHLANRMLNTGGIAEAQILLGAYEAAVENFDLVISFYQDYTDIFSSSLADAFHGRAKAYLALGQLAEARQDIAKSLTYNGAYKTWKISHYANLASVYAAQFEETQNPLYIDSLKQSIQQNDSLIRDLYVEHRYFEDEIRLHTYVHDAYAKNLEHLYLVYSLDKSAVSLAEIFKYMEGLKSFSLKEILKTDEAVRIGKVPEEILSQERTYKSQLIRIKKQLFKQEQTLKDSTKITALQKELKSTKDAYYAFLQNLEKQYPNYYRYQYTEPPLALSSVQRGLRQDEALLEYFISEQDIFALVIEKAHIRFYKIAKGENWQELLKDLLQSTSDYSFISHPDSSDFVGNQFIHTSTYFYESLLKQPISQLSQGIQYVKVVPDDELNFIPFGLLLKEAPPKFTGYEDLPYLLKDFTISYASSVSDYIRIKRQRKKTAPTPYLGIAPLYTSTFADSLDRRIEQEKVKNQSLSLRNNLQDLPAARESVAKIAKLWEGLSLRNQEAHKQAFLNLAQEANILHFAMHGVLDLENPLFTHLVFSDTLPDHQLYIEEILNLELRASLAVLSACNTGSGKMIHGDGVQSISRAFAFAGVAATNMSLWSVPDIQTAEIDHGFFEELMEGKRIDDALKNAQLDYLMNAPKQRSHPFYWAGFVPSGNMDMQVEDKISDLKMFLLVLGGTFGSFFLIIFLIYQRKYIYVVLNLY